MRYYTITLFGNEPQVSITEDQLQHAIYAKQTNGSLIVGDELISGNMISTIRPDYHRAMGWNKGHRLQQDDYIELRRAGIEQEYQGRVAEAAADVAHYIATGNLAMLGTPAVERSGNRHGVGMQGIAGLLHK